MKRHSGQVHVDGRLACVPQQAWLLNATLKDNVLFGEPFNKHRSLYTYIVIIKPQSQQHRTIHTRGATTSSKLGVQFVGLGFYYPSTEKIDRSTQFGAIGYIIALYSLKSYIKN